MNIIRFLIIGVLTTSIVLCPWCVIAGEGHGKTAINQIAEIMYRLKHFPSPQGKSELRAIMDASNSTKNQRVIATALINMQHQVMPDDILLLKKLLKNSASSHQERELSEILLGFSHRPTKLDKDKLKAMMQ